MRPSVRLLPLLGPGRRDSRAEQSRAGSAAEWLQQMQQSVQETTVYSPSAHRQTGRQNPLRPREPLVDTQMFLWAEAQLPLNFRFDSKSFGKLHVVLDFGIVSPRGGMNRLLNSQLNSFASDRLNPYRRAAPVVRLTIPLFKMALKIENKVELLRANLPEKRPHVFPGVPPVRRR